VAGCFEYGDEPTGSGVTELVSLKIESVLCVRYIRKENLLEVHFMQAAAVRNGSTFLIP
jgi:hypothetical protein